MTVAIDKWCAYPVPFGFHFEGSTILFCKPTFFLSGTPG